MHPRYNRVARFVVARPPMVKNRHELLAPTRKSIELASLVSRQEDEEEEAPAPSPPPRAVDPEPARAPTPPKPTSGLPPTAAGERRASVMKPTEVRASQPRARPDWPPLL